jgi:hypothetical protein
MNWKRIWISTLLVLVTKAVVGAIFFSLVFTDALEGGVAAFRAEGTERHGIAMVGCSLENSRTRGRSGLAAR